HDYTFLAGHRIGVVVLGNLSGYQPYANGVTLTVDTRLSHLELPVVGGTPAAAAAGGLGAPDPVTLGFELGGHGGPVPDQTVPYGAAPVEPPAPSETGWTF